VLTERAWRQVAAGMSVSIWVEIAAAAAGTTIKDSFSVLSEVKGDTFQVPPPGIAKELQCVHI
jgi:hypothetical protein